MIKLKLILKTLVLALLFFPSYMMADTQLTVILPGEHFIEGTGKTGMAQSQIQGIAFSPQVVTCDENHHYKSSFALAQLSASTGTFINNPHRLDETFGSALQSGYSGFEVMLSPGSNQNITLNVANTDLTRPGITSSQAEVAVVVMKQVTFDLPGTWRAGETKTITLHATDGTNPIPYQGQVDLVAIGGGVNGADRMVASHVQFHDGQATATVQLLYAGSPIYLQARNMAPDPKTITQNQSQAITVLPGVASRLMIIHADQQLLCGSSSSGSGRSGVISPITVNHPFEVTVYVTDDHYNIVNSSAEVSMAYEEAPDWGGSIQPASQVVHSGAGFTVNLRKVMDGQQTLTVTGGGLTPNLLSIPLRHGALQHFAFNSINTPQLTGQAMTLKIQAYDEWDNLITSPGAITDDVNLWVIPQGGVPFDPTSFSHHTIADQEFEGDGTWQVSDFSIYRAGDALRLWATCGGVSSSSDPSFDVHINPALPTRYVVVMPNQTFRPGEQVAGIWGRSNETPPQITAGQPVTVTIYVCDTFGNRLTAAGGDRHITLSSTLSDDGLTPGTATAVNGQATVSLTLTRANQQQKIIASGDDVTLNGESTAFTVQHHPTLDHFAISTTTVMTAGLSYETLVQAQDCYNNPYLEYDNPIYLTLPGMDYLRPTESVLYVAEGRPDYTADSSTAAWIIGQGFTGGSVTLHTRIYRATTTSQTAFFVSTNPHDLPAAAQGVTGQSALITVSPDHYQKVLAIMPGMNYRPGADAVGQAQFSGTGYAGLPLSHQIDVAFTANLYATDQYFNQVSHVDSGLTISTNAPQHCQLNGQPCPLTTTFNQGYREVAVTFTNTGTYILDLQSLEQGVTSFASPNIEVFNISEFKLEMTGGGWDSQWTAGIAKHVKITAYRGLNEVADTFNGTVELRYSEDYPHLKTISPSRNIQFSAGVWTGDITLYRADTNGQPKFIKVALGTKDDYLSQPVNVAPAQAERLLILEPIGMTVKRGAAPDDLGDPTMRTAIEGHPHYQVAGTAISSLEFHLCDHYWNTCTDAQNQITLNSTDPRAQLLTRGNLPLTISLNNGSYIASGTNGLVLYTVNGTTGQQIGASASGFEGFTLGIQTNAVPVVHAQEPDHFQFSIPEEISHNGATAGNPFPITVTAVDAYGNTMDAVPTYNIRAFEPAGAVNLSVDTDLGGKKSVWPYLLGNLESTAWRNGSSMPWVYLYKKNAPGMKLQVDFSGIHGVSTLFYVKANQAARLVPLVPGMVSSPDLSNAGGTYSDFDKYISTPPPADADVFNNFNDQALTFVAGDPLEVRVYSCDIYGNMVKGVDQEIKLLTTDPFAPRPADQFIDPVEGYASFGDFQFRTQGLQSLSAYPVLSTDLLSGSTPEATITPGTYYGLQILAPGQIAVPGSGHQGTTWYSGVTPTNPDVQNATDYLAHAQISGNDFETVVQSVDQFGNFIDNISGNEIELQSSDHGAGAKPGYLKPIRSTMMNGRATFQCCLVSPGFMKLSPYEKDNTSIIGAEDSHTVINVIRSEDTRFHITVKGIALDQSLPPVEVAANPEVFPMRVEVRHYKTNEIVAVNQPFVMEAFLDQESPPTPGGGRLNITNGITQWGVAEINTQSYTKAEHILIRVRTIDGAPTPAKGLSPELNVKPSQVTKLTLWADTQAYTQGNTQIYQLVANEKTTVFTRASDVNGNPVGQQEISTIILSPSSAASRLDGPMQTTTNSWGEAYQTFYAGAINARHVIESRVGEVTGTLLMDVTVTPDGGVYPNPCAPRQGRPAHIDYFLRQDAHVKLSLYTLMGDLVWSKEIPAGDPNGGHAGVNTVIWEGKNLKGVHVANGGYICAIYPDQQQPIRFKIGVLNQ